jgi:flagellin
MSGNAATVAGTYALTVTTQATKATNVGAAAVGATAIAANDTITINGQQIGLTVGEDATSVANKINAQTDKTNVVATVDSGTLTLTQKNYGPSSGIVLSGTGSGLAATGLTAATTAGVNAAGTLVKGGVTYSLNGVGDQLYGNVNTDTEGMVIRTSGTGSLGNVVVTNNSLKFQVGANAGQTASVSVNDVSASKLGATATGLTNSSWKVADIDVTSFAGAQDAIKLIDSAISEVSASRAQLGSFQKNQLESNINSLGVAKENIAASESSIRDVDMAAEMVTFSRNQIMEQAGTSMLTQANQAPQNLLSLLK